MMRTMPWPAVGAAAALALAACSRSEPTARVEEPPACRSAAVEAQLKPVLLAPPEHSGRRYASQVQGAQLALTQVQVASFDADTRVTACSATARLSAPRVDPASAESSQRITYTVSEETDGAVKVSDVQAADGGDLGRFALLLETGRRPLPPPATPVAAPVAPLAASLPDTAPAKPHAPPPLLSDDTQSLVDQAGDSRPASDPRSAGDNQTEAAPDGSPTP